MYVLACVCKLALLVCVQLLKIQNTSLNVVFGCWVMCHAFIVFSSCCCLPRGARVAQLVRT
jgi:hypothetical protein